MPLGGDFGSSFLCSHSKKGKLWVSLVEKAFLKVNHGGYDLVGNNPSRDLYSLTGWLPEKVPLRNFFEGYT